jgi:L-rhamnose mutarotase
LKAPQCGTKISYLQNIEGPPLAADLFIRPSRRFPMKPDTDPLHFRGKLKRYCKTIELRDDPRLIEQYRKAHAPGAAWPEITEGMREVGIIDMEIYIHKTRLFMIMDTVPDFDHDRDMAELAKKPRQDEWEALMSRFQNASPDASADQKWQLMERIYRMEDASGGDG